jgi:hypothetical protein
VCLAGFRIQRVGGSTPVLAYLFTLRRARHPIGRAWSTYFAGCAPGSYTIHIHVDPTFNQTDVANSNGPSAKYFKQENVLPRESLIKVRRFGHELVQARMRLLRAAVQPVGNAPAPLWYSFFSESCAPVSTCEAAHAYLAEPLRKNRSFIDNTRPMPPQQVCKQRKLHWLCWLHCASDAAAARPAARPRTNRHAHPSNGPLALFAGGQRRRVGARVREDLPALCCSGALCERLSVL